MNFIRRIWLAAKVKAALGGNVDAIRSILSWVVKLGIVPQGWLTIGAGFASFLVGVLCYFGVQIPGIGCPADPMTLMSAGLIGVGLGRRKS